MILFLWLFFPLVGAIIGQRKNAAFAGFLYGLFFGPIGCLVAILLRGSAKTCPKCGESVRPEAQVCRFCRADLGKVWAKEADLTVESAFSRLCLYFVLPVIVLGGLMYFLEWKSDYDREQARQAAATPTPSASPAPVLVAATPLPSSVDDALNGVLPTATPSFQEGVARSQRAAVKRYPQLGVKGSALNTKFLERLSQWQSTHDPRFRDPTWPERLAEDCAINP